MLLRRKIVQGERGANPSRFAIRHQGKLLQNGSGSILRSATIPQPSLVCLFASKFRRLTRELKHWPRKPKKLTNSQGVLGVQVKLAFKSFSSRRLKKRFKFRPSPVDEIFRSPYRSPRLGEELSHAGHHNQAELSAPIKTL